MGLINTGAFAKALYPGVNKWYGDAYNEYSPEWTALFDSEKSTRAYEEDVSVSGLGLASAKTEGNSVVYDEMKQGYLTRYTPTVYALGFMITREMYEDDQYGVVGKKRAKALAFSMRQTKEIVAANVYNRAFNSSYTGGDAKELCATDHPNVAGGTWANEPSTAADISEAALEQAVIDISKWENDRGLTIAVKPKTLIIPVDLQFDVARILRSVGQVDTADNNVNALRSLGYFQNVVVNHYLSDADAWFIRTNCPDGMKHFQRRAPEFTVDNEFDTENAKYKATERYSFGWSDPRAVYGSPGA